VDPLNWNQSKKRSGENCRGGSQVPWGSHGGGVGGGGCCFWGGCLGGVGGGGRRRQARRMPVSRVHQKACRTYVPKDHVREKRVFRKGDVSVQVVYSHDDPLKNMLQKRGREGLFLRENRENVYAKGEEKTTATLNRTIRAVPRFTKEKTAEKTSCRGKAECPSKVKS